MIDNGSVDDKIIAVPFSDPTYNGIESIDDIPSHIFDEIMHFFTVYKQLENKQTAVKKLYKVNKAQQIIKEAMECYTQKYCSNKTEN